MPKTVPIKKEMPKILVVIPIVPKKGNQMKRVTGKEQLKIRTQQETEN